MGDLLQALQAVVVKDTLDLTELDPAYVDPESGAGLTLEFRLNWTRGQKDRQRALQQETFELQMRYGDLKELVEDEEKWRAEREELERLSEENWRGWAGFWAGVLLMEVEEAMAMAEAIPEQHWVWITQQVSVRAKEYEEAAVKKAGEPRSRTSGKPRARRRSSGKKQT